MTAVCGTGFSTDVCSKVNWALQISAALLVSNYITLWGRSSLFLVFSHLVWKHFISFLALLTHLQGPNLGNIGKMPSSQQGVHVVSPPFLPPLKIYFHLVENCGKMKSHQNQGNYFGGMYILWQMREILGYRIPYLWPYKSSQMSCHLFIRPILI